MCELNHCISKTSNNVKFSVSCERVHQRFINVWTSVRKVVAIYFLDFKGAGKYEVCGYWSWKSEQGVKSTSHQVVGV